MNFSYTREIISSIFAYKYKHSKMKDTNPSEELVKILIEKEENFERSDSFKDLKAFAESMQEKGILKPSQYTLPMIDTIGRNWYQSQIKDR